MLRLSAYSIRHHFTALMLTLPLVTLSFSVSNYGDLDKAIGLAAFLVASIYYLFLYKYKAMLAVGFISSSIFVGFSFLYFISSLFILPCGLRSCSFPEAVDRAASKASWAVALVLLNLILIVVYVIAGVRLGLRERRA